MSRECKKCKKEKDITKFKMVRGDRIHTCIKCQKKRAREYWRKKQKIKKESEWF